MHLKLYAMFVLLFAVICLPLAYADSSRIACIIPNHPEIVFWSDIENSIQQAADELGVDMLMLYTKHTEPNLELTLDEALAIAIYSDVDAIITSYTLADSKTDKLLADADEKGIHIIMIDCDCPPELRDAYIGIDNEAIGNDMGKIARNKLGADAHALLVYPSASAERENLSQRIDGVRYAFASEQEKLAEYILTSHSVQTVLEIREIIEGDPSITTIIPISENSTLVCAQALSSSVRADEICLYGFDESYDTLKLLEDGVIEALACQTNSEMGYKSVQIAKALIDGDQSARGIHLIDCIIRTRSE